MRTLFLLFLISVINFPTLAYNEVIGCVNGAPIFRIEYDRLFQSELKRFENAALFDPWQSSSYEAIETRNKLIENAESVRTFVIPEDITAYKNLFAKTQEVYGEPINTYDLNLYAEQNAKLLQYFRQQNFEKLSKSLIERELLSQNARKRGIRVAPEELEQKMNNIKAKYGGDNAFKEFLRTYNSTELEFKLALEQQLLAEKLKGILINKPIQNSEENQNANQEFENWLEEAKRTSKIAFSLNPNDPEIKVCMGNFNLPRPRQIGSKENEVNASYTPQDLSPNKDKENKTRKFKEFWEKGKEKFSFKR